MQPVNLGRAAAWMLASLIVESAVLPHWIPIRWIPQFSFLILLFAALRSGIRSGVILGLVLGAGQAFLSAIPGFAVVWVYVGVGALAGAAKSLVFLESPLAQWLSPIGFGLLAETMFFWMMPWDDAPLGWSSFWRMIRASNLPLTCVLSGFVYAACHRFIFFSAKKR